MRRSTDSGPQVRGRGSDRGRWGSADREGVGLGYHNMSVTSNGICDRRPFNLLCLLLLWQTKRSSSAGACFKPPRRGWGGEQAGQRVSRCLQKDKEGEGGRGWCLTTFGALTLSDCLPAPIKLNSIGKRRSASDDTTNCGSNTNKNNNNNSSKINAIFA